MAAPRLLVLGAHPDDAEFHAGGLIARYRQLDREVKLVSVTNGASGHHQHAAEELLNLRRAEAASAGMVVGASYETWDFPDGELLPTLEVRRRVIREIRQFAPDLVLTHRTCDYHPDHRAVAQAVQDACYMVKVPLVVPDVPALGEDPVVAFMTDLFTRPTPLRPDVVLDVTEEWETVLAMLACHRSQVYEFLPFVEGILDRVPDQEEARREWLAAWFADHATPRAERFRSALIDRYGAQRGRGVRFAEAYEISEYARQADAEMLGRLFPETNSTG